MYHRYMPNANGQYRRQTVQEAKPTPCPPDRNAAPERSVPKEACAPKEASSRECTPESTPPPARKECPPKEQAPKCKPAQSSALSTLFPGIDSGDLLLLALLLLLISEGTDDTAPTILTLALALIL